jgi:hypothetical protein
MLAGIFFLTALTSFAFVAFPVLSSVEWSDGFEFGRTEVEMQEIEDTTSPPPNTSHNTRSASALSHHELQKPRRNSDSHQDQSAATG